MCVFKSGIAVKVSESEVDVRTCELVDSHTEIRKAHGLPEDGTTAGVLKTTPLEAIPTRLDAEGIGDEANWKLRFDAGRPDWWTDGMTGQALRALIRAAKLDVAKMSQAGEYGGSLDLSSVQALPAGFAPKVGGNLDLSSATALPEDFAPTVGGYLDLRNVTALPKGFAPTVGGNLYLRSVTALPEGFAPTVGGNLYLRSVTALPKGFAPKVGGNLYLRSVTALPAGFAPHVGGYLDLSSATALPEDFAPTVGGYLYLRSVTALPKGFNRKNVNGSVWLKNGKA